MSTDASVVAGVDLLKRFFAHADESARRHLVGLTIGAVRRHRDAAALLEAVVSESQYRSAREAGKALGVSARAVQDRRRRAARAVGLDGGDPCDRMLLSLGIAAAEASA